MQLAIFLALNLGLFAAVASLYGVVTVVVHRGLGDGPDGPEPGGPGPPRTDPPAPLSPPGEPSLQLVRARRDELARSA